MARRLNDTSALTARPMEGCLEKTRSVRKIDNGYLVRESTYNSMTGECRSRESYSKKPAGIGGESPSLVGNEGEASLRDTMQYLNNDK